jgi:SAM-dependent methyltransferase
MLLGFGLLTKFDLEYVGLDILPSSKLREYAELISESAGKKLQVVRGSAENLPFREGFFDLITAFDVLEHLENPRHALFELSRIIRRDGLFVVSLPLENRLHRLARIFGGALIGKPWRIGKSPDYHYASEVSSYGEMVKCLDENFIVFKCIYTPIGFASLININGILFCHARVS